MYGELSYEMRLSIEGLGDVGCNLIAGLSRLSRTGQSRELKNGFVSRMVALPKPIRASPTSQSFSA